MNISYEKNYEQLSTKATAIVLEALERKNNLLLCAATGNSPTGLYKRLGLAYKKTPDLFKDLRLLKLDEWLGLEEDHPSSCGFYLQKHLIKPLDVSMERYMGFSSKPNNAAQECERFQKILQQQGPIDLCILGVGKNGHLGFNEPSEFLAPFCHIATLLEPSTNHQMLEGLSVKPTEGLTLGMSDILSAKRILLLICGPEKQEVVAALKSKKITTHFPFSLLWLHEHVDCLVVAP